MCRGNFLVPTKRVMRYRLFGVASAGLFMLVHAGRATLGGVHSGGAVLASSVKIVQRGVHSRRWYASLGASRQQVKMSSLKGTHERVHCSLW